VYHTSDFLHFWSRHSSALGTKEVTLKLLLYDEQNKILKLIFLYVQKETNYFPIIIGNYCLNLNQIVDVI